MDCSSRLPPRGGCGWGGGRRGVQGRGEVRLRGERGYRKGDVAEESLRVIRSCLQESWREVVSSNREGRTESDSAEQAAHWE